MKLETAERISSAQATEADISGWLTDLEWHPLETKHWWKFW